jgi:hypothetical protein
LMDAGFMKSSTSKVKKTLFNGFTSSFTEHTKELG